MNVAGVVAALAAEARALGPAVPAGAGYAVLEDGNLVALSGIGACAARGAALRLLEAGATSLVSWGLAGGLDPELEVGAVCLPGEVIAADGSRLDTARSWRESLSTSLSASEQRGRIIGNGPLLTAASALETRAAKDEARTRTGACAVDMESSAIAQVADVHGVPFIAVRVIIDTARDSIPPAVARASRAGKVQLDRLILGLVLSPLQIGPLLGLARRYRVAMRSLEAVARLGTLAPPSGAARSREP